MPKHVKLLADLAVVPEDWVNGSRFTVEPKNSEKCQAQNHFKILRSFLDPARRCRAGGPLKNSCSMLQPSKSQQFPTSLNWKWKRQRCARCHRSLGIYAAVCRADRMHSESLQYGAQKKKHAKHMEGTNGPMGTHGHTKHWNLTELFKIVLYTAIGANMANGWCRWRVCLWSVAKKHAVDCPPSAEGRPRS